MNWTGGRLNRHAKTNQNPAFKAQKQHFARAALYNTLHAQDDQSAGSTVDTIPIDSSKPVPQLWQKAEEESKYPLQDHDSNSANRVRSINTTKYKSEPVRQLSKTKALKEPAVKHREINGNSIEAVRKRLLQKPDWLGLSASQPVKIEFKSAGDMARIGRNQRQRSRQRPKSNILASDYGQKFLAPVLRKRKRDSDTFTETDEPSFLGQRTSNSRAQVMASSPPVRAPLQDVNNRSDSTTSQSLPSIPRHDLDRRSYELRMADEYPGQNLTQLISLENIKHFSSFDDIQNSFLSSNGRKGPNDVTRRLEEPIHGYSEHGREVVSCEMSQQEAGQGLGVFSLTADLLDDTRGQEHLSRGSLHHRISINEPDNLWGFPSFSSAQSQRQRSTSSYFSPYLNSKIAVRDFASQSRLPEQTKDVSTPSFRFTNPNAANCFPHQSGGSPSASPYRGAFLDVGQRHCLDETTGIVENKALQPRLFKLDDDLGSLQINPSTAAGQIFAPRQQRDGPTLARAEVSRMVWNREQGAEFPTRQTGIDTAGTRIQRTPLVSLRQLQTSTTSRSSTSQHSSMGRQPLARSQGLNDSSIFSTPQRKAG